MGSADSLSTRQESILAYIEDFISKRGIPPSIRNIKDALNISSTSVVAYNLKALQDKGKIDREMNVSRGIRLTTPSRTVRLLGVITAGSPLPDPEDTTTNQEHIEVPPEVVVPTRLKDVYALKVRGLSMIDALIDDGDIILLRFQETAENGDMVAAMIVDENAVTLKKFYHEGGRIRLQPANSTMDPIYTSPDNVRIQGRVVGVLRSLY
jgi:repressor LexA